MNIELRWENGRTREPTAVCVVGEVDCLDLVELWCVVEVTVEVELVVGVVVDVLLVLVVLVDVELVLLVRRYRSHLFLNTCLAHPARKESLRTDFFARSVDSVWTPLLPSHDVPWSPWPATVVQGNPG